MRFDALSPKEARRLIADGTLTGQTAGMCPGYAQGNLVILPTSHAEEFKEFAAKNPKACPVLEVLESGEKLSRRLAEGDDLAKVVPRYRVFTNGVFDREMIDVSEIWRDDLVTFVLGCSFTFESALIEAGIPLRHIEMNRNIAMYITNIQTVPVGRFSGPVVVSMRPIKKTDVQRAIEVTAEYPLVHGTPLHVGDPSEIGITDIDAPDFGDSVPILEDEVPVFWACGVTPQMAIDRCGADLVITHSPGHMLITDLKNSELEGYDEEDRS